MEKDKMEIVTKLHNATGAGYQKCLKSYEENNFDYEKTLKSLQFLTQRDYNIVDVKECDFKDLKQQLNRIEELVIQMTNEENGLLHQETMSLYAVIEKLRGIGNQFTSWHGIQTNITSIELTDDNKVIVKIKE